MKSERVVGSKGTVGVSTEMLDVLLDDKWEERVHWDALKPEVAEKLALRKFQEIVGLYESIIGLNGAKEHFGKQSIKGIQQWGNRFGLVQLLNQLNYITTCLHNDLSIEDENPQFIRYLIEHKATEIQNVAQHYNVLLAIHPTNNTLRNYIEIIIQANNLITSDFKAYPNTKTTLGEFGDKTNDIFRNSYLSYYHFRD